VQQREGEKIDKNRCALKNVMFAYRDSLLGAAVHVAEDDEEAPGLKSEVTFATLCDDISTHSKSQRVKTKKLGTGLGKSFSLGGNKVNFQRTWEQKGGVINVVFWGLLEHQLNLRGDLGWGNKKWKLDLKKALRNNQSPERLGESGAVGLFFCQRKRTQ